MLEKLRNIFQIPELRRRILFTLGLFVIYRLGEHVPTPGVNVAALEQIITTAASVPAASASVSPSSIVAAPK